MDEDAFRTLILDLAGPSRDRARLARLLHVSESTAYGWLRLSTEGSLSPATAVRGDANRAALRALARAADRRAQGVPLSQIEVELEAELGASHPSAGIAMADESVAEHIRRASLQRGLSYALKRLGDGASTDEVLAATEAVVAMVREGR